MKLWKGATFVFMFCGALQSLHLTRNIMATAGPSSSSSLSLSSKSSSKPQSLSVTKQIPPPPPPSSSSSPSSSPLSSSSSSSSWMKAGLHRTVRAVDTISSLSQLSHLLQSFTEGELKKVIGTLMDRSSRSRKRSSKSSREEFLEKSQESSQRTKRAKRRRRRLKPCSLQEVEVTVGELGLGYDSDETLLFRYCSGRCTAHRRNYDITLEHMRRAGLIKKGRRDKVLYSPCCQPITYEKDISFLDNNSRYHTVQEVSAQECGCA